MQKQRIPGVSLAVVKNGQVLLDRGYGLANVEHQVAVRPETVFQSGSVGKQFTATAVMMLVEEGKINLDEKISKYLGDMSDDWKNITVRHLLTHTSGLTDVTDDPKDFDFRRDYTEDELLKRVQAIPVTFQPGEKWQYSNIGYVTLGIIIGKVTGKFYGDFLQERIFKPLEMITARIISESDIVLNRAAGYQLVKGELKNQEWVSPTMNTTADGSLYLTALDMVKWDAALNGENLLKKTSLEQMWTAIKLNDGKTAPYGFGWFLDTLRGHRIFEHGGRWQGFVSFIARYPDDSLTVIFFANLNQVNPAEFAHGVAGIYNSELRPPLPISEVIAKTIEQKGIDAAIIQYRELKHTQPTEYYFNESLLNNLGYNLLISKKQKEAIEIFKLNVEMFPQSSNVYDSLGEAYMVNGDKELAIKNYEKSLELNSQNTNAVDMLKKLRENK
jgi:CubicO group peptidase (beta-lactamase class C family)